MPYRLTLQPIDERRQELDQILANPVMVFRTNEPRRLAYRIREAMNAAAVLQVEPYNQLQGAREVITRPPFVYVRIPHEIKVETAGTSYLAADEFGHSAVPEAPLDVRVVTGCASVFAVVGAMVQQHMDALEVHFPDYEGETDAIESWALENGWVVTSTQPLTIQRQG